MKSLQEVPPVCLLLTATVQVSDDMCLTVRRSTNTRLEDYKTAFRSWVGNPHISSIVFVENSGFDLAEFEAIAKGAPSKRIEFLSFRCPPFDGSLGKGYGEMLCLEHCLNQSKLLNSHERFLKATGRYYVANADSLLRFIAEHPKTDAICNFSKNFTWADSRAFGGTTHFLKYYLCTMKEDVNDTKLSAFEHVLARSVHKLIGDSGRWSMTPDSLDIVGISGSMGTSWKPGAVERLREKLRHKLLVRLLKGSEGSRRLRPVDPWASLQNKRMAHLTEEAEN